MSNGQQQQIQVSFPDNLKGGAYSNNMFVSHTKEEFIMDFLMVGPKAGAVNSRIIISPGHMKRIIKALQNAVNKYEKEFGSITEAKAPDSGKIGFK
jgi:hypothetical protein